MTDQPYQPPSAPKPKMSRSRKAVLWTVGVFVALAVIGAIGDATGAGKKDAAGASPTASPAAVPSAKSSMPPAASRRATGLPAAPANGGTYPNATAILAKLATDGLACLGASPQAAASAFWTGTTSMDWCNSPGASQDTAAAVLDNATDLQGYKASVATDALDKTGLVMGGNWAVTSTNITYAQKVHAALGGTLTIIPAGSGPSMPAEPADPLTGFGATVATWDANHTADDNFDPGSAFDPEPNLPQNDAREGDRYVTVQYSGGLVTDYQVNEPNGTTVTAAFADVVARELPSDTVVMWKLDQTGCEQEEVESKILGTVLAGYGQDDPQGAVFLEVQSPDAPAFDPSNIAYVTVDTLGSLTASQAPGC